MCLITNPGYSPSLTLEHDPHLHPLPGQGEEDAKRLVRVVPFVVWPVALVLQTWDPLGRGIAFHQAADRIPPIVVEIGNRPREFLIVHLDAQLVAADFAKFLEWNFGKVGGDQ